MDLADVDDDDDLPNLDIDALLDQSPDGCFICRLADLSDGDDD